MFERLFQLVVICSKDDEPDELLHFGESLHPQQRKQHFQFFTIVLTFLTQLCRVSQRLRGIFQLIVLVLRPIIGGLPIDSVHAATHLPHSLIQSQQTDYY